MHPWERQTRRGWAVKEREILRWQDITPGNQWRSRGAQEWRREYDKDTENLKDEIKEKGRETRDKRDEIRAMKGKIPDMGGQVGQRPDMGSRRESDFDELYDVSTAGSRRGSATKTAGESGQQAEADDVREPPPGSPMSTSDDMGTVEAENLASAGEDLEE